MKTYPANERRGSSGTTSVKHCPNKSNKYKYWKWNKTLTFADDMTVYIENPRTYWKKLYLLNINVSCMFNKMLKEREGER